MEIITSSFRFAPLLPYDFTFKNCVSLSYPSDFIYSSESFVLHLSASTILPSAETSISPL